MSPFRSKYKVTQEFGTNAEYYKQFGLKGHEGGDYIPTGTSWDVLALADGVVILDDDFVGTKLADPYGIIVTLWHPALNKATMYCHLAENTVTQGQTITKGQKIGVMGSTGNSTGAHLHLNLFNTDTNGVRLDRTNGYNGGIDPLPFLEANDAEIPQLPQEPSIFLKTAVIETYVGILGVQPSEDELNARMAQLEGGTLLHDIISQILNEDGRSPLVKLKEENRLLSQTNSTLTRINLELKETIALYKQNSSATGVQSSTKPTEASISIDNDEEDHWANTFVTDFFARLARWFKQ